MAQEQRSISLSVILSLETLSYVRNQDEKQLFINITENEDFNNQIFKLAPNNEQGSNPRAEKSFENIESFFYAYSAFPVEAIFTRADDSQFTLKIIDLVIVREAFDSVLIRNRDADNAATVKVVYS